MRALESAEQSDEVLVGLTLERGSQYFGKVVKRHSDYLFGLGMRLSGGHDALAKDMSQQAFIKAFKYLANFDPKHSGLGKDPSKRFRNWLTGIAVNCYSDLIKIEAKYVAIEAGQLECLEPKQVKRDHDDFNTMIRPLNTQQRQLVTLRFVYEPEHHNE